VIRGGRRGARDGRLSAGPGLLGSARSLLGPGLDRVGAREQLIGTTPFGGDRVDGSRLRRGVQVDLLLVEQRLMFVAGALGVVKHVLGRGTSRLRESGLDLATTLLGLNRRPLERSRFDLVVELRLLLVKVLLLAVSDRLLAVAQSLLETGDSLVGVKALLGTVLRHLFSPSVGTDGNVVGGGRSRDVVPLP